MQLRTRLAVKPWLTQGTGPKTQMLLVVEGHDQTTQAHSMAAAGYGGEQTV